MGGRRSFLSSLITLKFSCFFLALPSERIWGRVGNKGQLRLIDLTWITSLALCVLPYIWGLYATLISVPSVPDGGSSPYAGVTVKSGSELGAKNASNGRVCLKKVDYTVVILKTKLTIQKGEDKKVNAKSFYFTSLARKSHHLVLVVQALDSAIHRIDHYPANSVIDFRNTYPLESAIQRLNNRGLTDKPEGDGALIPPGPPYPIWRILKGTQSMACV